MSTFLLLSGCALFGQFPFTYDPIPGVPQAVNDLGQLIGQQQHNVVTPGGDVWNPGYSDVDRAAFENSNGLGEIVSYVTASREFRDGVDSIRTLPAETQELVFDSYSTPIDPTWAMTGQIGNGTTEAGYDVEQQIATALTNAVRDAL
ncbi:MAG TPA: hypothetical protein VJL27_01010 [Patescibacteria group bacterium]|nr:hypothetical protein [Patescibacteria group bacterium]